MDDLEQIKIKQMHSRNKQNKQKITNTEKLMNQSWYLKEASPLYSVENGGKNFQHQYENNGNNIPPTLAIDSL